MVNRFKALRAERNLTQQQVAEGAGISRPTVIKLENVSQPNPSAQVAYKLSRFYGVPVAELMAPLAPVPDDAA